MTTDYIISTKQLSKQFGSKEVLRNCQFRVKKGDIYGLLGVNGSGKSTLFKLLTGLLIPSSGEIEIVGKDITKEREAVLAEVGLLIENAVFYDHLSAQENLAIHLAYMGKEAESIPQALKEVGLEGVGQQKVAEFSLGMRQRLAIARTIIHRPKVLILDEPINGLDPIGIRDMRLLFKRLAEEGVTVIISSHILSELEHTVNTIGVLADGSIVKEIEMAEAKAAHPDDLEDYFIELMTGGYRHA